MPSFTFFHVSCAWGPLDFLSLWVILFMGIISAIISSNIFQFLSPFSRNPITHILDCSKLSLISLMLYLLFLTLFFPVCSILNSLYCYIFKFYNLFIWNIKSAINPIHCIFRSHIVLFMSRSLIWVLFFCPLCGSYLGNILSGLTQASRCPSPHSILTVTS